MPVGGENGPHSTETVQPQSQVKQTIPTGCIFNGSESSDSYSDGVAAKHVVPTRLHPAQLHPHPRVNNQDSLELTPTVLENHSVTVVVLLRHREIGDGDTDTTQQVDTSGDDHSPAQDHPSVFMEDKDDAQ